MRLIATNIATSEWPKRHNCENCGAELEYDEVDVHIGWMGCEYVTCPNCNGESMVGDKRIQAPTWNVTFRHNNVDNCIDVKDVEIQEYINKAVNLLSSDECEDGDSYCLTTGNLVVAGWKHDDGEIDLMVSKDFWEDSVMPEDYGMVK